MIDLLENIFSFVVLAKTNTGETKEETVLSRVEVPRHRTEDQTHQCDIRRT